MLEPLSAIEPLLRCPASGAPLHRTMVDGAETYVSAGGAAHRYPLVAGIPVLVDFTRSVLDRNAILASGAQSPVARRGRLGSGALVKRLFSERSRTTAGNVGAFIAAVTARVTGTSTGTNPAARVLIVGGGTIGQGMDPIYADPRLRLIAFDIYRNGQAQFVADAHAIPLADASVEGVIVQAVLEHVLDPVRVVDEIWRVLKPGGTVYAETPFLQHVHEGAYDFTRFTESGHRYLFRRFALIASGSCGGAGTQLMWSIEYFARGLFRSRLAGKAAKLLFVWLRAFDRLIPERFATDAASGVYFLGRKSDQACSPEEIIAFYRGAQ